MNVKLIGYTPNPEKIPAMAGMLTHSKSKPEDFKMQVCLQIRVRQQIKAGQ